MWVARDPKSGDRYVALFNLGTDNATISAQLGEIGMAGKARIRDLWARTDISTTSDAISATLPAHGAALYRLSQV